MALLTPIQLSRSGADFNANCVTPTASTGDTWNNTGHEFLAVMNGSGGPITVTIPLTATVDGVTPAARTVSVPAPGALDQVTLIGPFQTADYNDGAGLAKATCSSVSSIRIAVVQINTTS